MTELTCEQTSGSFVRSALMLTGCTAVIGLLLLPFAIGNAGSAGPAGIALAAAVCLGCGCASEATAYLLGSAGSPIMSTLLGMSARILPPLVICLILAAQGSDGRRHLAFVCYLLAFYLAVLGLETWLAVKRVQPARPDMDQGKH